MSVDIRNIDLHGGYCTKSGTSAYYGDKDCQHLVWNPSGMRAMCSLFLTPKTFKPTGLQMGRDWQYRRCKACKECTLITHKPGGPA
jgi:hypothetical protein